MSRFLAVVVALLVVGVAPSLAGDMRATTGTPPTNTVPPAISGTAQQGSALVVSSTGSWSGDTPMTYTFVWERCDNTGTCSIIPGAAASTYTLQLADVGDSIVVAVTAHNATGAATATSAPTAVVTGATPPANTAPPSISGTPTVTSTVTAANGTWTGTSPIAYTYQWQRCDAGGGTCAPIAGATSQSYVVASADLGHTLRVAVSATNGGGGAQATSGPSAVVAVGAPVNTVPPVVTGTTKEGQTLTATAGTWTGAGTITYALQWWRCQPDGSNCSTIANATSATHVLAASDVGWSLKMRVTASNAAGSTAAASDLTAAVAASTTTTTTTTTTTPTPSGTVKLPNGEFSVPAANLPATDHLAFAKLTVVPTVSRKRAPVTATLKVVNSSKYDVSGALVTAVAAHSSWAKITPTAATATDGTVSIGISLTSKAPKTGRLVLTVTVRTKAVTYRRLISFRIRP